MKRIAEVLLFVRCIALFLVGLFAAWSEWDDAFFALVIGWATVPLEDAAAQKLWCLDGQYPSAGSRAALAFGSSLVPTSFYVVTGNIVIAGEVVAVYTVALVSLLAELLTRKTRERQSPTLLILPLHMAFRGVFLIGGTICWFAYMAYGVGITLSATAGVLVALAIWRRNRMLRWLARRVG